MHDVFIRRYDIRYWVAKPTGTGQKKKITLTLDAYLREAHAGSLATQAWGVTAQAWGVAVQAWGVATHAVGLRQVRRTIEDLDVDLSENASIGAEGGGYVFALNKEAYGANEETLELLWLDEFL